MAMKDALLPEFDHEMSLTRKLLACSPMGDRDWKPHVKSMSVGELVKHLAEMPGWFGAIVEADSFDLDAAADAPKKVYTSNDDALKDFDAGVAKARAIIAAKSDAEWMQTWTLKKGTQEIFSMPKAGVVRTLLMNHMIHHRGQLSVYVRLKDVPVPSIYGPSADEKVF